MNIYLIGSNSFIGGHLLLWLKNCNCVFRAPPYDKNNPAIWRSLIVKNICEIKPDIILIPGASQEMGDDPDLLLKLIESNCLLPSLIASNLLKNSPNSKLVIFGTSWQYADSDNFRPFNLYAASKQAGQDLLVHYALKGLKILNLIIFDTYGENDKRNKLLNLLYEAQKNNKSLDTTQGDQEIDLVHIDDICEGVEKAFIQLENWNPSKGLLTLGLGSGEPILVKELIRKIGIKANFGFLQYRDREVMRVYKNYKRPDGWIPKHSKFKGDIT